MAPEIVGVVLGIDAGMLTGLDGMLFGRETKGVPAHGVKDIEVIHPLVSRDDIRGGVAFRVPHVKSSSAGVGEHVEHVVFRLG